MNRIPVGVIGCGYWGPNLIRNFSTCPLTEVAAVCDASPARLEAVASVVLESPRADEGTISHSFNVSGWPSYYLLDAAGTVESSAPSLSKLAVPVLAGKQR